MEAKKGASRLLGCYRTGDAHDPETYISAVVAVLSMYPPDVIQTVTEPTTGLPSRSKWLPTIAEIKSECEAIEGPRRRAREWDQDAARQLEERKLLAAPPAKPRKTYEQLQAELAEVGIYIGGKGAPVKPVNV